MTAMGSINIFHSILFPSFDIARSARHTTISRITKNGVSRLFNVSVDGMQLLLYELAGNQLFKCIQKLTICRVCYHYILLERPSLTPHQGKIAVRNGRKKERTRD